MRALTLWQPWAWAISHAGKRIENRKWKPPRWIIGERIAIHAGKKFDKDDAFDLLAELELDITVEEARFPQMAVVAVATVKGYVMALREDHPQFRWFAGPYGWVLDDVIALEKPVECKGALKLWFLPVDVEAAVIEAIPKCAFCGEQKPLNAWMHFPKTGVEGASCGECLLSEFETDRPKLDEPAPAKDD